MLNLAEPASKACKRLTRYAVGKQEIYIFLLRDPGEGLSQRHLFVRNFYYIAGGIVAVWALNKVKRRWELSRAKHRSLAGHSRWGKRLAALVPYYEYDEAKFFCADDASVEIVQTRRDGFKRLTELYATRFSKTVAFTKDVSDGISDLQFINRYRIPYQFSHYVRERLSAGSFMQSSSGVMVTDLDGNQLYDLTGSYGVNVFGYDFYKECIERGGERVRELGPVLGAYHPVVAYNVKRLREISQLDEVSFHMSGTEAVMQAVRLARYHTRRTHLVRLCGAYHGWWGDVQPGAGNPSTAHETYTLKDMAHETLHVLRTRKNIACVLVNPLQALHPNISAPGDSTLLDSSRSAYFDRVAYTQWLQQLREVCTQKKIVLIFDEVFVGFRLAGGGAQEYFGVKADMVTYGKTLGGGLPIGALCGRANLMRRFRDDRPADICFARGTFNSHPYVMASTYEFLQRLETDTVKQLYNNLDEVWNARAARVTQQLRELKLPLQVANLSSIFTMMYTQPSRYNWMLQYYLRAQGLALSWVGTGRFIFSLNYTDADFEQVVIRIIAAAQAMQGDGWWWRNPLLTNKLIKRKVLKELIAARLSS